MSNRRLILIKHARPIVDPAVESSLWQLSDQGLADAAILGDRLASLSIASIYSSREPKAAQTADAIATRLGLQVTLADGLHEHDRSNVPYMASPRFVSLMELFFRTPDARVLGLEAAKEAGARIALAVDGLLSQVPEGNPAIVTHGTVLALLLQDRCGADGFGVWRSMQLPSYAVVGLPEWKLVETVLRPVVAGRA